MNTRKPVVLVAPLDWGLGHTLRCVPIINQLQEEGVELLVACNQSQREHLSRECSALTFIDLQGYGVHYGKNRLMTIVSIVLQGRKILRRIRHEREWLTQFTREHRVDAVISDNRYGLAVDQIPCIFITHQLRVHSGLGRLVNDLLQNRLYRYINKFTACWVPDWENPGSSLAGELSHPTILPNIPVKFIGCLSRFKICDSSLAPVGILIILSGPEPQRTALEEIMMAELKFFSGDAVLVRGVIDGRPDTAFNKIRILGYASAAELNTLICSAEVIICRPGYTSVMDLTKLGKRAILVPTPGQAEQEYIATRLHRQNRAAVIPQDNFRLAKALEMVRNRNLQSGSISMDDYKETVKEFGKSLGAPG